MRPDSGDRVWRRHRTWDHAADILTAVTHGGAVDLSAVPDPDFMQRLIYCLLSHVAKGELFRVGEIERKSEKGRTSW